MSRIDSLVAAARGASAKTATKTAARKTLVSDPRQQVPTPNENPNPTAPARNAAPAPSAGLVSDENVTVTIPKGFLFTRDDGGQVKYEAGIGEMPRSHAEHWYSKAHGVEIRG